MEQKPTLTEQIGRSMNLAAFCVMSLATYWTLVCRKIGTVGPKMYAPTILPCMFVMAVLLAGSQAYPLDQLCFKLAIPGLLLLYAVHLVVSMHKRWVGNHVHTYHVGEPRLNWRIAYHLEVIFGFAVGAVFIMLNAPNFGWFTIASAFCSGMTIGMFRERDKMRGYVYKDAVLTQERMQEIYGEGD
jgi:hypothetical protein